MALPKPARVLSAKKENDIVTTLELDAEIADATPGQFVMLWLQGFDEKPY